MKKKPTSSTGKCPIAFALDRIGDKWSLIILRDIVFKEKRSYGEFLTSPEKISTNILANRLQKMESQGLLEKTQDTKNMSKYLYRLTQKGKDLIPLLLDMAEWSTKYDPQPGVSSSIINGAPKNLLQKLRRQRSELIKEIIENMKD